MQNLKNLLNNNITKTDYMDFLKCEKNVWLRKNKPYLFEGIQQGAYEGFIQQEGNEVDVIARDLFPDGLFIPSIEEDPISATLKACGNKEGVIFQGTFTYRKFLTKADILVFDEDKNGYRLIEVKASTKLNELTDTGKFKNSTKRREYANDLAFQQIILEKNDIRVVSSEVMFLNSQYYRQGDLDLNKLFEFADLSDEIDNVISEVRETVCYMEAYLDGPELQGCGCIYKGRSAHCETFAYSNPDVPECSIHDLRKIGMKKKFLKGLVDNGILEIKDLTDEMMLGDTNEYRATQRLSTFVQAPVVDSKLLQKELDSLEYPLVFLDYEGIAKALPPIDGVKPWQQLPFEFVIEILNEDGTSDAIGFVGTCLNKNMLDDLMSELLDQMSKKGSIIVWNQGYESKIHNNLAELYPQHKDFLMDLNDRMYDLEEIFSSKNIHVDHMTRGRSKLKYVLPAIQFEDPYKDLDIQDGGQAVVEWLKMIDTSYAEDVRKSIGRSLFDYCALDAHAMLLIYKHLAYCCLEEDE